MGKRFFTTLILLIACGDGDARPDPLDAAIDARVNPELDAAADARADASLDGGEPYPPRSGYACELDQDYQFGKGGPPTYLELQHGYRLQRGGRLITHVVNNWQKVPPEQRTSKVCWRDLPPCGSPLVDGEDLNAVLRDSEVVAAFEAQRTVGASIGNAYYVTRADGRRVLMGNPCAADAGACEPVPPKLDLLRTALQRLADESTAEAGADLSCATVPQR